MPLLSISRYKPVKQHLRQDKGRAPLPVEVGSLRIKGLAALGQAARVLASLRAAPPRDAISLKKPTTNLGVRR